MLGLFTEVKLSGWVCTKKKSRTAEFLPPKCTTIC